MDIGLRQLDRDPQNAPPPVVPDAEGGKDNAKAPVSRGEKHRAAIGGYWISVEIPRDIPVGNGEIGAEGSAIPLRFFWAFPSSLFRTPFVRCRLEGASAECPAWQGFSAKKSNFFLTW